MTDSTKIKIQSVLDDLINRKRIVFWYDEEGQMQKFASSLEIPGVEVLTLNNNMFTIKYKILKGEQPERGFIIYSPQEMPDDEDNWLLDLQMEGILFSADMSSLYAAECGIPIELKEKVVNKHIEFFSTKSNRDGLASRLQQGMDANIVERQMLAVVCHTEPQYDQLTYILAKEAFEGKQDILDKLIKYNLHDLYWDEIEQMFGYNKQRNIKDLLIVLFKDDMYRNSGKSTKLTNEAAIFMHNWRDSRQFGNMYKKWATLLETELGVEQILQDFKLENWIAIETFPCVDIVISKYLRNEVLSGTMAVNKIESIISERENKLFFSVAEHTLKALLEARRTLEDIDQKMNGLIINSPEEGFGLYIKDLYSIDLNYRHFINEASNAECKPEFLSTITEMVQRAYTNSYLMQLANKWQPIVDNMKIWQIGNIISQRRFFDYHVTPFVEKKKKLFVIISDALRYETMKELQQRVNRISRMETTMKTPMLASLPSYTQLGMAALLPNRELSYEKNADVVFIDGMSSQGTEGRKKVLCNRIVNSLAIRSAEFLSITSPKVYFKDYDLIYIYSNVIDKAGDNKDTEGNVFKATEDEFDNIVKIVELIRNGNGANILITSDHGYLYQNEQLDESDFTDFKVMGDIITDSRRFVIGNNLQPSTSVKTWNSEDVGLKAGLQIQTAKGMNRMRKQGSGSRFVHGGSMLQEVVVPVLHINIKKIANVSQVDVDILNQRAKLTTNNQTISFFQTEAVTEKVKGLTLRIAFYDVSGNQISDSFTTTFASESNDTTLREQKHTFIFGNRLSKLNGQEVVLKMERSIPNTNEFTQYKEYSYKVNVMFQAEF